MPNLKENTETKFLTTELGFLGFFHLKEPDTKFSAEGEYKARLMFDKENEEHVKAYESLKSEIDALIRESFPGITKKQVKALLLPLRDGDNDPYEPPSGNDAVRGRYFLDAKSKFQPRIYGDQYEVRDKKKVYFRKDPKELEYGNLVRFSIEIGAHDMAGKKAGTVFDGGVFCRLGAVQYAGAGEMGGFESSGHSFDGSDLPTLGEQLDAKIAESEDGGDGEVEEGLPF